MAKYFESGTFVTGCNYWASHAGTQMWSNWSPETVAADFKLLAANYLTTLRVFPLWPDFQPLNYLYHGGGIKTIYMGENPLPDTEAGRAGVDEEMMARFRFMADEAAKNGIKLIVGLVTGWMSGRLFVPKAFEEVNVLTHAEAIKWQVRFVRYFVRQLKDHPAVAAWDLGNECNCLGAAASSDEAWTWTNAIASAIRLEDDARPVVSGMHSLQMTKSGAWLIADQAELTDILTTHPYPLFTPKCNLEPFNTIRNTLHATVESCFYGDLGGKPCMPEEVGNLGPMICSNERAREYLRSVLFSCWAHDLRGLLWWCAFDQDRLTHAPYDWVALERELGMFRADYTAQPVVESVKYFNEILAELPFAKLPSRRTDAVCILTSEDTWEIAFGSFILAKQAGFDLVFHDADTPLPDSKIYLLPSNSVLTGGLTGRRYRELLAKVEAGSELLVTAGKGMLQPFEEVFGVRVDYRHQENYREIFRIDGIEAEFELPMTQRQRLLNIRAEVLGTSRAGDPILTRCAYGKGRVWLLNAPMEGILAGISGGFEQPFYQIYRKFFQGAGAERCIGKDCANVGVTEHPIDKNNVIGVLVNYCPETAVTGFHLAAGWEVAKVLHGNLEEIPGNDVAIVQIVSK